MNGMIYIRGHASDYEGWAQVTGDRGWAWQSVLPLFKRSESHKQGASEYHGADGPLPVSTIATPHPLSEAFVDAAMTRGHKPSRISMPGRWSAWDTTTPPRAAASG